jgi:hypothetical protein
MTETDNGHEPIMIWGFGNCSKCGAAIGSLDYTLPCTIKDNNTDTFGTKETIENTNPIAEAVRMSAFDRMDRKFKK